MNIFSTWVSLVLIGLSCMLVSCAGFGTTTTQFVGAPRFPPNDSSAVEILRIEPERPHERLGEIVVDASIEPAPPIEKLRTEGGKLGADAVIVVYDGVRPVAPYVASPLWGRSRNTITGATLVGVAIRYQQ